MLLLMNVRCRIESTWTIVVANVWSLVDLIVLGVVVGAAAMLADVRLVVSNCADVVVPSLNLKCCFVAMLVVVTAT